MKIRSLGADFFHADRDDEAINHCSKFFERVKKQFKYTKTEY